MDNNEYAKMVKSLMLLNQAAMNNIKHMQEVEKQLDDKIKQFEEKIDNIMPMFAERLSNINHNSMREVMEETRNQLQTSQSKVEEIAKINSYKPMMIITIFCIFIMTLCVISVNYIYSDIKEEKQEVSNRLAMIQQYGKDVTLTHCQARSGSHLCVKIYDTEEKFKDDKGNTYVLVKK
jgi:ABC-type antimicrobial peptide transport system permease subunit